MATLTIWLYITYILFIAASTIYVAHTLFTNSMTFMNTIFQGRESLAYATNKLFETGFFLFAFGIGLFYLETYRHIETSKVFFEVLSIKIGGFTIFLGFLLFFNLFLFFRGMKHRRRTEKTNQIIEPPQL